MVGRNNATPVIIPGKLWINKHFLSSSKDEDSCNEFNSKFNCTKCDIDKHRILLSLPPSECTCESGWYDPGVEECKQCHYSWFIIQFITLLIVLIMSKIVVHKKMMQIIVLNVTKQRGEL